MRWMGPSSAGMCTAESASSVSQVYSLPQRPRPCACSRAFQRGQTRSKAVTSIVLNLSQTASKQIAHTGEYSGDIRPVRDLRLT